MASRALELDESGHNARYLCGITLGNMGSHDAAIDHLTAAIQAAPDITEYRYRLSTELAAVDRVDEAFDSIRLALEQAPDDVRLRQAMVNLLNRVGRFAEALQFINSTIECDPENPSSYGLLGLTLSYLQRYDESVAAFDRALEVTPTPDQSITNNRGEALLLAGRIDEAGDALRQVVDQRSRGASEARLLLAIVERRANPEVSDELIRAILADDTEQPLSPFRAGEVRAVARLLQGNLDGALAELATVSEMRRPSDVCQPPLYRQLRAVGVPDGDVDAFLKAWPTAT